MYKSFTAPNCDVGARPAYWLQINATLTGHFEVALCIGNAPDVEVVNDTTLSGDNVELYVREYCDWQSGA